MFQAVIVRGSNPVIVKEEERNKWVEDVTRIVLLYPKAPTSNPVVVKKGVFEGQTSVFFPLKDCKVLCFKLLAVSADSVGAYMVTKYVQRGIVHFCIEWLEY